MDHVVSSPLCSLKYIAGLSSQVLAPCAVVVSHVFDFKTEKCPCSLVTHIAGMGKRSFGQKITEQTFTRNPLLPQASYYAVCGASWSVSRKIWMKIPFCPKLVTNEDAFKRTNPCQTDLECTGSMITPRQHVIRSSIRAPPGGTQWRLVCALGPLLPSTLQLAS